MITPDELRRKSFSIAKKGYDRSEVTNYLAQLALQLDTAAHSGQPVAANAVGSVDATPRASAPPPSAEIEEMMRSARDAVLASRERAESEYGRLIAAARTRAAEIEAQAVADAEVKNTEVEAIRRQAQDVLSQAEQDREETRAAAAAEAEELLVAATAEANRIRSEAQAAADEQLQTAQREAEELASSAHQDAINVLTSAESEARTLAQELVAVERRTSDRLAETRDVIDSLLDRIDRATDAPSEDDHGEPVAVVEPEIEPVDEADQSESAPDDYDALVADDDETADGEDADVPAAIDGAAHFDDALPQELFDPALDGVVAGDADVDAFPWEVTDPVLDEPVLVDDNLSDDAGLSNGHGEPVPADFAWADEGDHEPEGRVEERWAAFETALAEMRAARDDIDRLGTGEE